ncbi:MAG: hypothetical protein WBV55_00955 [Candidatus Sulfotelmatobacter sp.]
MTWQRTTVAANDGKGNTYIATPIIQVKPAVIICGLRQTDPSCASGAGNTTLPAAGRQLRCDGGTKKIQFGFWDFGQRWPLHGAEMSPFEEILRISAISEEL